jgi:uncharacterized protein
VGQTLEYGQFITQDPRMAVVVTEPTTLHLEEHRSEATSVVVHQVLPAARERFLELQRGIARTIESFPGYRRTEVYAAGEGRTDWVVVMHFDDRPSLDRWLASPERAQWTDKLTQEMGEYHLKTLSDGFGQWFASLGDDVPRPPGWKMALTVWLGLYPTVMILTLLIAPYTRPLGLAISILIGNALSVSILQWAVMPMLTKIFRHWLGAPQSAGWKVHLRGAAIVLFLLAAWTTLFTLLAR